MVERTGTTMAIPLRFAATENTPDLGQVLRLFEGDVRITEVEFESGAEVGIVGAAGDLFKRVGLERIYATEADQAIGVLSHLCPRPVVLGFDAGVFVLERLLVRITEGIGD